MMIPPLPNIKELLRIYKIKATKKLSQNFLLDTKICDKIIKAAGGYKYLNNTNVIEVGPGPGSITRSVLNAGVKKLIVIEKDERFLPTLKLIGDNRLDIIIADILNYNTNKLNFNTISWNNKYTDVQIIGNLPFNISTYLLIKWLHDISERRNIWSYGRIRMTLTFQEEVAKRIVSIENDKENRCRLSVMCQTYCQVQHKFTIPGSSFIPKPDVNVGVVNFIPRIKPLIPVPFIVLEKLCRILFSSKQKYCKNNISKLFPIVLREKLTSELLKISGINGEIKAINLTINDVCSIAITYWNMCENYIDLFDYDYRAPINQRDENKWLSFL